MEGALHSSAAIARQLAPLSSISSIVFLSWRAGLAWASRRLFPSSCSAFPPPRYHGRPIRLPGRWFPDSAPHVALSPEGYAIRFDEDANLRTFNKFKVFYSLCCFSQNLEYALYNGAREPIDDEIIDLARDSARIFDGRLADFYKLVDEVLSVEDCLESLEFIM